jgi:hypothetical protein
MRPRGRKLSLDRETLVTLKDDQLAKVEGGQGPVTVTCMSGCSNRACPTLANGDQP